MACKFVSELSKLRKLSMESVENTASFDAFKKYLHVLRPVEVELRDLLNKVNTVNKKTLILSIVLMTREVALHSTLNCHQSILQGEPVVFRTVSNGEIITSNSYIASIPISELSRYDLVSGVLDTCVLHYSGCAAGIESMMYRNDYCTFELSSLYPEDYEDGSPNRFLPYESYSHNPHGFAMRMIDDPKKYNEYPLQKEIGFLIAWAYTEEATWNSQADFSVVVNPSIYPYHIVH